MAEDFHVKGKVSVDGSSLGRAADSIKTGLSRAFGSVAGSFRGALLSVFSAGALTALIGNNLRKALEQTTEAGKAGVSTEEYATLARLAEQTGVSVEEIAKQYIKSKEKGGEFATTVRTAMKELLDDGLIPTKQQTEEMTKAMLALLDAGAKTSVVLGDLIANITKSLDDEQGGFFVWIAKSSTRLLQILSANVGEAYAWIAELVGMKETAKALQDAAIRERLRGYGIDPDGGKDVRGKETKPDAFGRAKAKIVSDAADAFKASSLGGSRDIQAPPASSLTQIGGYMTRGISSGVQQEYQLKLVNRKLEDLVATVKRGQM